MDNQKAENIVTEEKTIALIELICNASAMTNKWIKWGERAFEGQETYTPAGFQLRDAFSHMVNMYTHGIDIGYLDPNNPIYSLTEFYKAPETFDQLEKAFDHVSRAFFDCADFILIRLTEGDKKPYFLRLLLSKYGNEIDALRASKSEIHHGIYETMEALDKYLQLIAGAYDLESFYSILEDETHRAISVMDRIESSYSRELIDKYDKEFFSNKKLILSDSLLSELHKMFADDGLLLNTELDCPPYQFSDKLKEKIDSKISETRELRIRYESLCDIIMKSSGKIEKGKSIRKTISNAITHVGSVLAGLIVGAIYQNLALPKEITQQAPQTIHIHSIIAGLITCAAVTLIAILIEIGRPRK